MNNREEIFCCMTEDEETIKDVIGKIGDGETGESQRTQKEILKKLLAADIRDEEKRAELILLGIEPSVAGQLNLEVIKKAENGDLNAMKYIRDTIGEKPRTGMDIGNLENKPFETIDLSALSDTQLKILAAKKWRDES